MKKVFLDDLPRKEGIGANKGKMLIDWTNSIGYKVRFIYDDIEGWVEIAGYDGVKLKILYNNEYSIIFTNILTNCHLGGILKVKNQKKVKWHYKIGQILSNDCGSITILEHIKFDRFSSKYKEKGYRYKCNKCNTIYKVREEGIKKRKRFCNVCSDNSNNTKVVKGINDIATTHPYLVKYFVNIEDTYIYSYGSNKKTWFVCDYCGHKKYMMIGSFIKYGIQCSICGDGKSYSEKFLIYILNKVNENFVPEYTPSWSNRSRYDFYFNHNNEEYIVETHGLQHYEQTRRNGARTLEEEQKNDKCKKELAISNGIKEENYIVIDCRKSELEWIKQNILSSRLNEIFDLNRVDWNKCEEFALGNLVKEACDLWNSGVKSTKDISNIMKLNQHTIVCYLKKCSKLNLCDYTPNHWHKKIKCKTNGIIFNSGIEASKYSGAENTNIMKCCKGKRRFAGKDEFGNKLEWEFLA